RPSPSSVPTVSSIADPESSENAESNSGLPERCDLREYTTPTDQEMAPAMHASDPRSMPFPEDATSRPKSSPTPVSPSDTPHRSGRFILHLRAAISDRTKTQMG